MDAVNSKGVLKLPELIAMGVGGMIGGGTFTVLGLAVGVSGHDDPLKCILLQHG